MATGRIGTTPVLQVRWSKAPSAGTTSLSGLDDNSVSLVYSVGYEAVYRNGTLLSRGNDYTATNGTTITLVDATLTGDIIEVFANQTIPLTDTYSQTVSDGRFIKNTLTTTTGDIIYASAANTPARLGIGSTDQVLKVSGGIPAWGALSQASAPNCTVYEASTFSFTGNTESVVTYANEETDTDGFHSTTTNTGRMTIPTGLGGVYIFTASFLPSGLGSSYYYAQLMKNGSGVNGGLVQSDTFGRLHLTGIITLAAGDYVDSRIQTGVTGSFTFYRRFSIARIGL
jgi:hypothetical protein